MYAMLSGLSTTQGHYFYTCRLYTSIHLFELIHSMAGNRLFPALSYSKVILVLCFVIILLQGFIMMFLMQVEKNTNNKKYQPGSKYQGQTHSNFRQNINDLHQTIVKSINSASIMDSSGEYFIVPAVVSSQWNQSGGYDVGATVCTQTTANHLRHLLTLSESWAGPLSVTVFTYGQDAIVAIYSIIYLHVCFESVRTRVTFHLAFPISHPPSNSSMFANMTYQCTDVEYLLRNVERDNYAIPGLQYPHNVLRNIAIMNSLTSHVLVIDIDMVPSEDFHQHFMHFLKRRSSKSKINNEQIAYVVPSFESKQTNVTSLSKHALINEWDNSNVRPFYYDICWKCQKVTDYEQWRNLQDVGFLDVGYYTEWEDPWEPFYIAHRNALPLYDGRFKQYGFNRISQVCEMQVAGFRFAVLNNAFLVHRGFKTASDFHVTKDQEQEKNKELFREFKKELKNRYPDTKTEC